jgi:indole-3-acetate monooxygenase
MGTTVDLVGRAKALQPLLNEFGWYGDEHGCIAPEVIAALHENGLFKMWEPTEVGGFELDPISSLEVLENLSYGDASAGWVVMAACLSTGTGAAYLGKSAVDEMWSDGKQPIIAGQGTRPGFATPVDGGYLLTGEWSFASGLLHGTHIHTLGIITTTGEPRIFVVPVDKATLLGNWDVMGLRGTGSVDYRIDDVFVPEDNTHFAVTETAKLGGNLYGVGIIGFAEMCHSGWAMGVGRRLLDELATMAQEKTGRAGNQVDSDSFVEQFAKAEASFRAARAFVMEAWRDMAETIVTNGEKASVRQHTLVRLALTNITQVLHEVSQFVYLNGGTTALRRGVIQRFYRDVHAGTQHVTSSPKVVQTCGKELAGLAPDTRWQFLDLVPAV